MSQRFFYCLIFLIVLSNSIVIGNIFGGKQKVVDHGNTFLTIKVKVGGQTMHVIPDSGSFELYILNGDACGNKNDQLCKKAYKPHSSSTHRRPLKPLKKDIVFGSGTARCTLGFDHTTLAEINEPQTASNSRSFADGKLFPLWEIEGMTENLLDVWGDGRGFQGILGMGFKASGGRDSDETVKELQTTEAVAKVANISAFTPVEGSRVLFTDSFALCLPRGNSAPNIEFLQRKVKRKLQNHRALQMKKIEKPNEDGMLWWGQAIPQITGWAAQVRVIGSRHWAIGMKRVSLEPQESESKSTNGVNFEENLSDLNFCHEGACTALIDSGTSLLAFPRKRVEEFLAKLNHLNPDCSNAKDMPYLRIDLESGRKGDHLLITPESYIMRIETDKLHMYDMYKSRLALRSFAQIHGNNAKKSIICTPAFMISPIEQGIVGDPSFVERRRSALGRKYTSEKQTREIAVLGIPLFREYFVKFDRSAGLISFAKHPEIGPSCSEIPSRGGFGALMQHSGTQQKDRATFKFRDLPPPHELMFPSTNDLASTLSHLNESPIL